jgi:predicted transcriptional regulator
MRPPAPQPSFAIAPIVAALGLAAGLVLAAPDQVQAALDVLAPGLVAPLPLLTRIGREEALENDLRRQILEVVREEPGICAGAVADRVGAAWGTALYHLRALEETDYVSSLKHGRHRRYFERGGTPVDDKEALAVLQNDTTAEVHEVVRSQPGLCQSEIADEVGLTPQALAWHLNRLRDAGLVEKERDGRSVRYSAAAEGRVARQASPATA